jgi:hypothetical protein
VGNFQTGPNIRTLNVGNLEPGQIYCFRVQSFNDNGRSAADVDCLMMRAGFGGQ